MTGKTTIVTYDCGALLPTDEAVVCSKCGKKVDPKKGGLYSIFASVGTLKEKQGREAKLVCICLCLDCSTKLQEFTKEDIKYRGKVVSKYSVIKQGLKGN